MCCVLYDWAMRCNRRFGLSLAVLAVLWAVNPAISLGSGRRDDNLLLGFPEGIRQSVPQLFSTTNLVVLSLGGALTASQWNTPREKGYDDTLERRAKNEAVFNFGNAWGNGLTQAAVAAGCWGAGKVFGCRRLRSFGFEAGVALAGSAVAATALKEAVSRRRPDGGHGSFPSGHTTSAFAVVPAAFKHGGWKAGVPACLAGLATGLGRMEDHRHYLSDVTAGATLGLLFGTAACGTGGGWVPKPHVSGRVVGFEWSLDEI